MPSGYCVLAGRTVRAATPAECADIGGEWVSVDPTEGGGGPEGGTTTNGNCFVRDILTRSMGEQLMWLGSTYKTAVAFRESIIMPSRRGPELLKRYYKAVPHLFEAARHDPELTAECISVWREVLPYAEACLEQAERHKSGVKERLSGPVFTKELHAQCDALLSRFERNTADRNSVELVRLAKWEMARCVGLTPAEALALLEREDSA